MTTITAQKNHLDLFNEKDKSIPHLFHALDAARGIAALIVVLYHLPVSFRGSFFGSGDLAVDFFFALSGFVLAHAYLGRLISGRMSFRNFIIARLIRLYPLYALSLMLTIIILIGMNILGLSLPWTRVALVAKLPFAALMLPSPSLDWHAYLFPFTIAAWSIFLELAINLVFAVICKWLCNPKTRLPLILISGVMLAVQLMVQNVLGGSSWNTLMAGLPRVCFSFFLGVHIYETLARRSAPKVPNNGYITAAMLSLLLITICAPENLPLKIAAIFLLFPLILTVLAQSEIPKGRAGSVILKLGSLSYAIYIMHGPVLFAWLYLYLTPETLAKMPAPIVIPIVISVILVSWAAERFIDTPLRQWINLHLKMPKRPAIN